MTSHSTIKLIEEKIDNLPLVDASVAEVMALLNHIDSDFQKIKEKVSPEIAAKFLTMANSAYYGIEVKTIDFAVRILGYSGIRQILTTSLVIDHFSKRSDRESFNFSKFQREAHFCAAIAQALGKMLDYEEPAELFTVSMLHNIGELIIAIYFKDEQEEINDISDLGKEGHSSVAERKVLGVSHAEIGALVLAKFNLSKDICNAVRYHHTETELNPDDSDFRMLLISREAARIMDAFIFPRKIDPFYVRGLLEETAEKHKEGLRRQTKDEGRFGGCAGIFRRHLHIASDLIREDLGKYFTTRENHEKKSAIHNPMLSTQKRSVRTDGHC